ncbi:hypothetical protein AVDCRST_MAG82-3147, partial [uncultured Rubrobacteraceae bacterium]
APLLRRGRPPQAARALGRRLGDLRRPRAWGWGRPRGRGKGQGRAPDRRARGPRPGFLRRGHVAEPGHKPHVGGPGNDGHNHRRAQAAYLLAEPAAAGAVYGI